MIWLCSVLCKNFDMDLGALESALARTCLTIAEREVNIYHYHTMHSSKSNVIMNSC